MDGSELQGAVTAAGVIANVVDAIDKQATFPSDVLVMSSGAIVKVKQIPEVYLQGLLRAFPRPEVPRVTIKDEENGKEYQEENPNDPHYLRQLRDWRVQLADASMRVTLLRGIEVLQLPPGTKPFDEDKEFQEEQDLIGIDLHGASRSARYLIWLQYRIVISTQDVDKINEACQQMAGLSEEDIAEAMAAFLGNS